MIVLAQMCSEVTQCVNIKSVFAQMYCWVIQCVNKSVFTQAKLATTFTKQSDFNGAMQ